MENDIARNLNEGPDYKPDWRHRVVESYLSRASKIGDERAALEVLADERDPFVRQATRFRLGVRCVNAPAFKYAYRAQATNRDNGIASMIRAMAVADRRADEIAVELHVSRANVVTFLRTFFDVERYLGCETWLRTIAYPQGTAVGNDPESVREKRWLAVAFEEGWNGLQNALFQRPPERAEDVKKLRLRIQAALGSRALEFISSLSHGGVPASREDLDRFVSVQEPDSRYGDVSEKVPDAVMWIRALHGTLVEKAVETGDPELAFLRPGQPGDPGAEQAKVIPRYRRLKS